MAIDINLDIVIGSPTMTHSHCGADCCCRMRTSSATDILRVSSATLYRWEREGRITATRTLGGHRRYRRADIMELHRQRLAKLGGAPASDRAAPK